MAVPETLKNAEQLQELVDGTLKDYSSELEDEYYDEGILETFVELSAWKLPTTDSFQILWFIKRAKRHVLNVVLANYSRKFKYDKVNLQHRFANLKVLLEMEDKKFAETYENNISKFGNIDITNEFGDYAGSGIYHDIYGRECE